MDQFESRLRRVEDRLAIDALISAYTLAMDNRDLVLTADLFTENARFRSADGVMEALGRAAILTQYRGRFAALGFNFHVTHDKQIAFASADRATGIVSSHAEVVRNGQVMITAMRYHDVYERCADGKWRFTDRNLHFFYYLPVEDYRDALQGRARMRAYGDHRDAELPEGAWS
jgi:ketosteroid isomerase-like protein